MIRTILGMSLGASLMALALLLAKPLLKKYLRPSMVYGLWLLVLLRLCLPLPGFLKLPVEETPERVYVTPMPIPVHTHAPAADYILPPTPMPDTQPVTEARPVTETRPAAPAPAAKAEAPRLHLHLPDPADAVLWLWALGSLALIGTHMLSYLRFASAIRKERSQAADWERALLTELDPQGHVRLYRCGAVPVPMLLGFLHPSIVLSDDTLTESELRAVLTHELTHYRRGDLAIKWFATLLLSLHWFNPLCPLIRRELDHACELSCDEAVIAALSSHERQSYGETLIRLSSERGLPRAIPATTLSEGKEHLKERLVSIMNYKKRDPLTVLLGLVCALLLVGCGAAVGGAEQVPPTPMPQPAFASDGNIWASDGNIWASDGNIWASDGDAVAIPYYATTGDAQLASDMDWAPEFTTPGNARGGEEVRVSTVDEFLEALAPETTVVLEPGVYDLGEAQPVARRYAYWKPTWDGEMELVLTNLQNTRIVSSTGDPADVSIVTPHRTANVLRMEYCYSNHMEGITLGHSVESGICAGGVVYLENSYGLYMDSCDLYGCGSIGIQMIDSSGLTVVDSLIHDCSSSGVYAQQANTIWFKDTDFVNSGEFNLLSLMNCSWVRFEDCSFRENNMGTFLTTDSSSGIVLQSCELKDNFFYDGFIYNFYSGVEIFDTDVDESQYGVFYRTYGPESVTTPIYMDGEEFMP